MTTTNAPRAPRTAYLVLGMHRSGTSAITSLLAAAGAELPANVMPGDEHNARGYFEPWKVAMFNNERLREAGSAWDDVFAFPYRPVDAKAERRWSDAAKALFDEEYGSATTPLLKDPRVTVLLPFWREVLSALRVDIRAVIPVRHPLAVARSLARRDGFPTEKSVLLWTTYMLAAEAYTRDLPRAFVSYDGLVADWRAEAKRIETAHGAPLPKLDAAAEDAIDAFLSPDLRHNSGDGDLAPFGWAGALAAKVHGWFAAAAAGNAPPATVLDEAARTLAERGREFGALVSPVTRDLDAARAELLEAQQAQEAAERLLAAMRETWAAERKVIEDGWREDVLRKDVEIDLLRESVAVGKTEAARERAMMQKHIDDQRHRVEAAAQRTLDEVQAKAAREMAKAQAGARAEIAELDARKSREFEEAQAASAREIADLDARKSEEFIAAQEAAARELAELDARKSREFLALQAAAAAEIADLEARKNAELIELQLQLHQLRGEAAEAAARLSAVLAEA